MIANFYLLWLLLLQLHPKAEEEEKEVDHDNGSCFSYLLYIAVVFPQVEEEKEMGRDNDAVFINMLDCSNQSACVDCQSLNWKCCLTWYMKLLKQFKLISTQMEWKHLRAEW